MTVDEAMNSIDAAIANLAGARKEKNVRAVISRIEVAKKRLNAAEREILS